MNFGLALGGGGLRGAFHIGFLEVLLDNGIQPDIIAGTSAGAIVAGLYASGVTPRKMESFFSEQEGFIKTSLEKRLSLLPGGLIKGRTLEFILKSLTKGKKIGNLDTPIAIVATNIQNGTPVIFTSEKLAKLSKQKNCTFLTDTYLSEAIRASISIPGIFHPKVIRTYKLVDGGLISNVPADVLKFMGVEKVLAINLGFTTAEKKDLDSVVEILLQTIDIMGERISEQILAQYADMVVKPITKEVNLWDIHKIPQLLDLGRQEAYRQLDNIKKFLQ